MKQAKKIITRMLINNWGGISHRMMEFHEYVNLFSGKSGSGKSTVMDAVQVVLYGSVSASFLNKAADDAKNRRSVMSYLRGAQKDGTSNRADQDFYSTLVLEVKDTGLHTTTCFGAVFEIGRTDMDINGKYVFFSHSGSIPEDGYLNADGVPYSKAQIRKLCETRKQSADNRGRVELNRIYPSREAYVATLYDVILGGVDPTRLMTMEKSAIALRMTNGTGQFIRDYMFPRSQVCASEKISEQVGAPFILKIPDGSYSIGMKKVSNEEELKTSLELLFEKSAILLAQAFTPTEFDWRVGLLNGVPLYACKYYMAKGHWQIYCHYDSGRSRCGLVDTIPIYQVPRVVLDTAIKAANLIGKGLYGVDLKMVDDKAYVIEINDNPSIDHELEDAIIGDEMYYRLLNHFEQALEMKHY